ncbi:hypothetical protein KPH14_007189 [Odynerus spinipes]|uniref:Ion transport domain-containing protein n=1 Tax=Odynerus spinipes TaxID=1348599 RepID=A0AAD9R9Y1_9HYME|nr:hypothetical protein KPH14_007189 [Odynerus spinipes]
MGVRITEYSTREIHSSYFVQHQHGSVTLPQLQELEREFFELVANGSVAEVELYLNTRPDFKINVTNFQGITALHVAIEEKNIPMVRYLLTHPEIDPGDAHLYAIRENEAKIAGMILDKLNEISPGLEYASVTHSVDFPDEATPLAIAAQHGHYELIQYLIHQRLHRLERPHPPNCNCENVCKYETVESMFASFVFSPAQFGLSQFATDLIGCARKAQEVEIVLKRTAGFSRSSKFVYPRLLLALDYKQRTFVAHSNVQEVSKSVLCNPYDLSRVIESVTSFEFQAGPEQMGGRVVRVENEKNVVEVSHRVTANNPAAIDRPGRPAPTEYQSREVPLESGEQISPRGRELSHLPHHRISGYESILAIYVVSYLWSVIRLCIMHGPRRFFRALWNWYETCMILLFVLTFICWIGAALDVRINGQRELERKYWHKYDPTLVAEGIYCLATIMAFFRLMFLCQLNYHLGPLQLSLGKMTHDVTKFIVIFAIVLLAFTSGLCKLYQYYDEMVQIDRSNMKVQQVSSFVDFPSSLKTLFWAVFCMSPIESADVIIENLPGDNDTETIINHHSFTEVIGYIAFASFEFISVVVVLNMLIACMTNTFTKVTENVIVEWTFGRTEVYVDFMLMTTLPPPFNIIPTLGGFQTIVEYAKVLVKPTGNKRARWDFMQCCYIETFDDEKDDAFAQVMMQLVQRYFREKSRETEKTDVEKLRKELMEVRGLLREALEAA